MNEDAVHILLADDDPDDCMVFQEALSDSAHPTTLTVARDGEKLMQLLAETEKLFSVLFLDLNMPRKNGYECLTEIKASEKLSKLPVVIYSTSFNPDVVEQLYHKGAHHYIRKPTDFGDIKTVIGQALLLTKQVNTVPDREKFVIEF